MISGVLVKRIGRRFGNLKEVKRVLQRRGKSARTVSGSLEKSCLPIVGLLHPSRNILVGSRPSKPTGH